MDKEEIFEKLIDAYAGYYNIERAEGKAGEGSDKVPEPFDATGFLSNEAQQYFLVKAARIADVNSYEHVYFKKCDRLDPDMLGELDRTAWEDGISRVKPNSGHKNTDVALIVTADELADGVREAVSTYKHSKNYKLGLYGFSNYRLVVIEARSGLILTNRRGEDLRDFVTHITNK
jgi:hypothetical protein